MTSSYQKIILDRRSFTSLGLILSASGYLAIIDELFADENCTKIDIKNDQSPVGIAEDSIFYWIDGMRSQSSSNIAFYLHFQHSPQQYVERVVFTTGEKKTLGARYFGPEATNLKGYAPYIIFNRLDLRFSKRYFLIVQVKTPENIKIYRYTLDATKLTQSRFTLDKLPFEMAGEFKDKHAGQCYSSLHFQTKLIRDQICNDNGLTAPCFKSFFPIPQIKAISDNSQFNIEVLNQYPDVAPENYMRYFFLTDPVGRLLSLHKRNFGDSQISSISLATLANSFWKSRWGIDTEFVPKINDCPYILLCAENPKYGIFYSHIWLR